MFEARFQTFDDSNESAQAAAHLTALRAELKRRGLAGFVVPRADRPVPNGTLAEERTALIAALWAPS